MTYETAALISEILHYVLVLSFIVLMLFKSYKNFINLIIKIYLIFILWGFLCYIFQGCPITLFENWLSKSIYEKPFYPDYTFNNSDFYYLITNTDFYIPGLLGIVLILVDKFKDKDGYSTSIANADSSNSKQ